MSKIKGGYYIKARKIQESDIATAPPHTREIWDWILKEANHKDKKCSGILIKRGQLLRSYKDIQEGLKWKVGWRTERYSKHQCEIAMKGLKKATMITTTKTTRGMLITVLNYDKYQNPKNYDSHNEHYKKATRKPQTADTINKNDKNVKNENIASSPDDAVNKIFDLFYKSINPGIVYGNPTNREAVRWFIRKWGEEQATRMFKQVIEAQQLGDKYCPVATTPHQVRLKIGDFQVYFKKKRNNLKKVGFVS
jgi:hypothetical protein